MIAHVVRSTTSLARIVVAETSYQMLEVSLLCDRKRVKPQARIHTDFHRFTEIGQIFHKKLIFNNNRTFQFETWKMVWTNVFFFQFLEICCLPPPVNQKPGKAKFRELVSKKIPGGACPRTPLEACSLGPSFRKSVSIYPRSAPETSPNKDNSAN